MESQVAIAMIARLVIGGHFKTSVGVDAESPCMYGKFFIHGKNE